MSWMIVLTQLLMPLLLLAWLALFPAAGWLARGVQLLSVAAVLAGLGLAALWAMPPFWVPWVYGLALVLITIGHAVRGRPVGPGLWRASALNSVVIVLVSGLGLVGGFMTYQALQARLLPESQVADIAPPFPPGHYLVAHGGSTEMTNVHLQTLDETVERFRPGVARVGGWIFFASRHWVCTRKAGNRRTQRSTSPMALRCWHHAGERSRRLSMSTRT